MTDRLLKQVTLDSIPSLKRQVLDPDAFSLAAQIVSDVQQDGEKALLAHAERLGDLAPGAKYIFDKTDFEKALDSLSEENRNLLEQTAKRIRTFAKAQRDCISDLDTFIEGGKAGHKISAANRAGCYAPGGRYPLPSSVLMTAIPARVAGVSEIWVASPRPQPETLAACAVAKADKLVAIGGAQAIAALAYGAGEIPSCDVIVGPGNKYVTAAKKIVSGQVGIDMLAGPSELVVLADKNANPAWVAADLLAQAEHDPDAIVVLIASKNSVIDEVEKELAAQIENLTTKETIRASLPNGFAVAVQSIEQGIGLCDQLAPEHLSVQVESSREAALKLNHYGALFIGSVTAQVLGDYGAGPNHVLPTGGTARFTGGLSVFNFLRICTWLEITDRDKSSNLFDEAEKLAKIEGLEAHSNSIKLRR